MKLHDDFTNIEEFEKAIEGYLETLKNKNDEN